MANPKRSESYHHGSLADSLVDLAIEKLNEGAEAGDLSIRALAAELGVSIGAPYRHFPTAEALIAAIGARGFSLLVDRMRAAVSWASSGDGVGEAVPGDHADEGTGPGTLLERLGMAYVRFASDRPSLYRAMFAIPVRSLEKYPILAAAGREAYAILADAVAAFQATRHDARHDARMSPEEGSVAAWAFVHGLAGLISGSLVSRAGDDESLLRLMTALTRGL
jgi:AcrR family transcriptional regulator